MDFEVGDRVRCIDVEPSLLPRGSAINGGGDYLELGRVYTVQAVNEVFAPEIMLDVGAKGGPKLARRFVKVDPDARSAAVQESERV